MLYEGHSARHDGRVPDEDAGRALWAGLVAARVQTDGWPVVEVPLRPSNAGGSGTFLAAASDGNQWWVKPLNNMQGQRVIATEAIVGSIGGLLGVAVCETTIVRIPVELAGWSFRPGAVLEAGFAHASRAVQDAVEDRSLRSRDRDDNRRRHVGVYALYDLCWGGDDQWLYSASEDDALYSHDHGWYLPPTGPTWSSEELLAKVDVPHVAPYRR